MRLNPSPTLILYNIFWRHYGALYARFHWAFYTRGIKRIKRGKENTRSIEDNSNMTATKKKKKKRKKLRGAGGALSKRGDQDEMGMAEWKGWWDDENGKKGKAHRCCRVCEFSLVLFLLMPPSCRSRRRRRRSNGVHISRFVRRIRSATTSRYVHFASSFLHIHYTWQKTKRKTTTAIHKIVLCIIHVRKRNESCVYMCYYTVFILLARLERRHFI